MCFYRPKCFVWLLSGVLQNLGTIQCSNLCTEIVEYTAPDEVAVCNLASIAVNMFVKADKTYDFQKLHHVAKVRYVLCLVLSFVFHVVFLSTIQKKGLFFAC